MRAHPLNQRLELAIRRRIAGRQPPSSRPSVRPQAAYLQRAHPGGCVGTTVGFGTGFAGDCAVSEFGLVFTACDGLSEWPRDSSGWRMFRIRCLRTFSSGNPPSVCVSAPPLIGVTRPLTLRSQTIWTWSAWYTHTRNRPPVSGEVSGRSVILRIIGVGNVKNSSVWIHVARGALRVSSDPTSSAISPAAPVAEFDEDARGERFGRGRGERRGLLGGGGRRCLRGGLGAAWLNAAFRGRLELGLRWAAVHTLIGRCWLAHSAWWGC